MALGGAFYRGTDMGVLCFDITSRASFDSIENWHTTLAEYGCENMILVGSKIDKSDQREVTYEEAS